jgi:hypothetical protein
VPIYFELHIEEKLTQKDSINFSAFYIIVVGHPSVLSNAVVISHATRQASGDKDKTQKRHLFKRRTWGFCRLKSGLTKSNCQKSEVDTAD